MTHTSTEQPSDRFMRLWQAYCDKKSECEDLRERIAELEASQAQRVPLSDAQIEDAFIEAGGRKSSQQFWLIKDADLHKFVCGITQEKQG